MSVPTVRAMVVGGMVGALFSPAEIGLFALIVAGGDHRRRRPVDRPHHPLILDRKATTMTESVSSTYGVHSEVGKLRKVLVCAPAWPTSASRRPTATSCCSTTSCGCRTPGGTTSTSWTSWGRGVEVVELHELLAETMDIPEARAWLLDRKIIANQVGLGLVDDTRAFLDSLAAAQLAGS